MENMKTYCYLLQSFFVLFFFFFVLNLSNITNRKAYLVIIWILIWFFSASFVRKEFYLTIKKLKHVQTGVKLYNFAKRVCSPFFNFKSIFNSDRWPWSEIARFEIFSAIYNLIIATSFFSFVCLFVLYIFIQLDFCYINICYYH